MMKKESTEFLTGYLYSSIESKIVKLIKKNEFFSSVTVSTHIPMLWFGYSKSKWCLCGLQPEVESDIQTVINRVKETMNNGWLGTRDITITVWPDYQYFEFRVKLTKQLGREKLTFARVEEEQLGYPKELVSE